ncbi:hypothetical protein QJS04_geneDACA022960 [Acorus gramineus]|uniref:Cysteine-rich and transmembrane domain-containing protein 1 n=1 Tax=Acorus gramineus TaxID=55184 RepID=A0AAV9BSF1_ACOGR|nr:hypothetical protein QJS04_geneDACA022960 [Acorus gramineus]
MSQYEQQAAPASAYPPPGQGHPAEGYPQQAYVAPPPAGYPMKDGEAYPQQAAPVETKSRGDGFWKGCGSPNMEPKVELKADLHFEGQWELEPKK